jgi:hypothetical protein
VELFKHRQNKLTLLSLLSAVVVISTAITGISIYSAQAATDEDSPNTTTLEEARQSSSNNNDSATSSNNENAPSVDVKSLFAGLVVCDLGASEINGETHSSTIDKGTLDTPKVSVKVMTGREVASLKSNETQTSSSNDETNTASADCMMLNKSTSASSNNASATDNNNASSSSRPSDSNTSNPAASKDKIAVIEGQDFAHGQVVLVFSKDALVAIDDVDNNGQIDAKVPVDRLGNEINFVESGTNRTASFNFDGQALTSSGEKGNIIAGDNTNSTNSTKE